MVDPATAELTALELRGDGYVEVARVSGEDEFVATAPYAVVIRPADLVSDHRPR